MNIDHAAFLYPPRPDMIEFIRKAYDQGQFECMDFGGMIFPELVRHYSNALLIHLER